MNFYRLCHCCCPVNGFQSLKAKALKSHNNIVWYIWHSTAIPSWPESSAFTLPCFTRNRVAATNVSCSWELINEYWCVLQRFNLPLKTFIQNDTYDSWTLPLSCVSLVLWVYYYYYYRLWWKEFESIGCKSSEYILELFYTACYGCWHFA